MKKLLSAIAMTAMVVLGLVATTGEPASAACPYSACINTTTTVHAPGHIRAQHSIPLQVMVTAPGNATPTGAVTVRVIKANGKVKYTSTQPYVGGVITFVVQGLRHGYYTATATYTPTAGSVWNGSTGSAAFHVKKNRHHHHHH